MSTVSSHWPRLAQHFRRQGIHLEYADGVYRLHNEHAQAQVLLPASLPLEDKAVRQLLAFASVGDPQGHSRVCKACATPDFHPGSIAPVGSVVATDTDFVIPAAIGTDVNCGVALVHLGVSVEQLELHKDAIIGRLQRVLLEGARNVPSTFEAYRRLFSEGPGAFIEALPREGLWAAVDRDQLQQELFACIGLAGFKSDVQYAPEALVQEDGRALVRDPGFCGLGGGNHFASIERVDGVLQRHEAWRAGLKPGDAVLMIHTGSRDVGFYVGSRWMQRARDVWPAGLKHPEHGLYGLSGELADEYLRAMGVAARYAWANRMALIALVRHELAQLGLLGAGTRLIVDVPHNIVMQEQGLNIHRKGATPAREGDFALIPGSMGDASYLATGLGNPDWLWSCSHGAGRAVRRQQTRAVKPALLGSAQSWHCVTLREERRIEEAPSAYKPVGPVLDAQEEAGLITPVVRLKPWLTFKA